MSDDIFGDFYDDDFGEYGINYDNWSEQECGYFKIAADGININMGFEMPKLTAKLSKNQQKKLLRNDVKAQLAAPLLLALSETSVSDTCPLNFLKSVGESVSKTGAGSLIKFDSMSIITADGININMGFEMPKKSAKLSKSGQKELLRNDIKAQLAAPLLLASSEL